MVEMLLISVAAIAGAIIQNPWDQIVSAATFGLLAIAIIVLGAYVFSWLAAPIRIFRDDRETISRLEQTLKRYEPKLQIIFEAGKEPFDHTEPARASQRAFHIYRIGVKNIGGQKLSGCSIKLCDMKPGLNVYLPIALKQRLDNPNDVLNIPHKQTFDLFPMERVEVDVAALDEAQDNSEIRLCYALEGHRSLNLADTISRGAYELTIKAYAEVGQPTECSFRLWIEDCRLRFKEMKL
ncbi:MAG: hypothetical protein HYY45_21960 [Deltaproteobacteria bacterium]|nr:hypothetical protein [Deltaproteobacteria bacterium]